MRKLYRPAALSKGLLFCRVVLGPLGSKFEVLSSRFQVELPGLVRHSPALRQRRLNIELRTLNVERRTFNVTLYHHGEKDMSDTTPPRNIICFSSDANQIPLAGIDTLPCTDIIVGFLIPDASLNLQGGRIFLVFDCWG
jgi:hypothetical protein